MAHKKLHIGGKIRADGWEILDAIPADHVDHVGNANDLSRFPDDTFSEVYASHVVEHFDYKDELANTLIEWRRVLTPGGTALISVPDLDTLCRITLDKETFSPAQRFDVMRMMFGGHIDKFDYHVVGLNEEFLTHFLSSCGYINVRRVPDLNRFEDTSRLTVQGIPISLNMIAEKPGLKAASFGELFRK
ncbi:MAG: methyltransferase domain-containing protein [Betaproteobacteria bacterium]|nr:MAG: methyltransferase domain-containing protein [Betaproteobacteria bacterium]